MAVDFITKNDLLLLKAELISELKGLLLSVNKKQQKDYLKATEVRKMLGISANTLLNLRVTGKLRSSKVGGIHYYRYTDIEKLMTSNNL